MKVLIVRPGAIGDVILTLPAIAAVRRRHPEAQLTLAVRPDLHELLEACGYAEEFLSIDDVRWAPYHLPPTQFRERDAVPLPYTAAYVWMNDGEDFVANLRRGGIADVRLNRARPEPYSSRPREQRPASVYFADLLEDHAEPLDATPRLDLPEEQRARARDILTSHKIDLNRPMLVLIPGAGNNEKRLAPAVFAEAAQQWVSAEPGGVVVVITGPREQERGGGEFEALAESIDGTVLRLQPSLLDLAAVLTCARACVANDSGPGHIAAALPGVRTCTLFRTGEPHVWAPLNAHSIDLRRDAEDGLRQLRRILAEVAEFA